MKKTIAFLFAALAVLSSSAATGDQRLNIIGYRIGDTQITSNDGRITATNLNNEVKTDTITLKPSRLNSNAWFNITVPAGQEVLRWLTFNSNPVQRPPSQTNNLAGAVTQYVWSYDEKDAADKYIVVDFDYITYTLNYNSNGGSGSMSSESHIYTNNFNLVANAFTKTGYTFTGWTNSVVTTALEDGAQITDGSTFGVTYTNKTSTLYAKWNANSYSVRFNKNADDATGSMDDQQFIYDVAQNLSNNAFARNGYIFGGWTNSTGTVYADGASVSNLAAEKGAVVDLFAKWTLVYYSLSTSIAGTGSGTVSLNPSGGSYTNGATVVVTATPAEGSTFFKWSDGVTDNPRTYTMTGNVSVSAEFKINTYTVTFKDYDGTTLLSQVCNWGDSMLYPATNPLREGYRFLGWTPTPPSTVKQTATYIADYKAENYTVKFHSNYGGDADTVKEQVFSYGTSQNLTSVSALRFAKVGYSFANWKDDEERTYEDGEEVFNLATSGSFDMYAVWSPIEYTIAFDGNGAESGSVDDIDAEYDKAYVLPDNGFSKTGQGFKGWRLGNETYDAGTSVSNLTTHAGDTVTFYAVWSEPRYIAFNGNGATATNGVVEVVEFEGIETKTLPVNVFGKTGYTFSGWATNETDAAALSVKYNDGAEVSSANLAGAIGDTNEFFAVWTTNTYTVAFNPNCKKYTGEMQPQGFVYDQSQKLTANAFVNESGLHFSGWSNTVTGVTYFDGEEVSNLTAEANGTVTLNAIWDNGELSRAMHCDNLYWTNALEYANAVWTPTFQHGVGCQSDSAAVSVKMLSCMVANVHTNGILRFKWKCASKTGPTVFSYIGMYQADRDKIYEPRVDEEDETVWHDSGDIEIPSTRFTNGALTLGLRFKGTNELTMYIDQLTWTPADASVEPTEDDKPVISGFESATTETGSGFRIQISNASSDFDYQILGTNVLTTTEEWPVLKTLSGAEMNDGYTIEFDEDEPQMFYKVKVISK